MDIRFERDLRFRPFFDLGITLEPYGWPSFQLALGLIRFYAGIIPYRKGWWEINLHIETTAFLLGIEMEFGADAVIAESLAASGADEDDFDFLAP